MRYLTCLALAVCSAGCGRNHPTSTQPTGTVVVRTRPVVAELSKTALTTFDTLVVTVTGDAMDPVELRRAVGASNFILVDTLEGIPAGDGRVVSACTISKNGLTVNVSSDVVVGTIDPDELVRVDLLLEAVRGTLGFQILTPDTVTEILACFTAVGESPLCASQVVSGNKTALTIDYVPMDAAGIVDVAGLDVLGDTVYFATYSWEPGSGQDSTLRPVFTDRMGSLDVSLGIERTPVALSIAAMDEKSPFDEENGPIVISEIMYNANSFEYLELYNPLSRDTLIDTLMIQLDTGPIYRYEGIAISAGGFVVVGRDLYAWADYFNASTGDLDFNGTRCNWVRLYSKDTTLIDLVPLPPRSNDLGWPNPGTSKNAIVCRASALDVNRNNVGSNWVEAESMIAGTDPVQKGTPGEAGI